MLKLFTCCLSPHCQEQQQQAHSVSITTTERSFFEDIIGSKGGLFRIFRLAELKDATDNFRSRNILGRGAFGEVFKGVLTDGTQVAVKKLSVQSHQGKRQFRTEVTLLSTLRHVNLVRLLGCCAEQSERLLVYEYHLNGSLDQTLFKTGSKNLGWPLRREIIIGAAKGLQYLHEDSRHHIIHRDIKASNILLDEKFHARISDFGLARLLDMSQTHLSTGVAGTFGYLAPEYASSGNLTDKADVYSFGIVMLEVVSGRKNYNPNVRPEDQLLLKVV